MKTFSLLIVVLATVFASSVSAQSISVLFDSAHRSNNAQTFPLNEGSVTVSSAAVTVNGTEGSETIERPFGVSRAPDLSSVAVLHGIGSVQATWIASNGRIVNEKVLDFFVPGDESIDLLHLPGTEMLTRDNIANFSLFDGGGTLLHTISNSSQSAQGEAISGFAGDRSGSVLVAYNPLIRRANGTASRARLLFPDGSESLFFTNDSGEIKQLRVHPLNGLITILYDDGGQPGIRLFDRFGNELFSLQPDLDATGVSVSDDGQTLTIFSGSRAQAYRVRDGERLASASTRSSIVDAAFSAEEQYVVMITGQPNNGVIRDAGITIVDIPNQRILSEEISGAVSFLQRRDVYISRTGAAQFRVEGVNRPFTFNVSR
ncbi:MAG: hypothetical protein ACNA78_10585 [Balneolaceae bacterium]